jgi:hypothetical protein
MAYKSRVWDGTQWVEIANSISDLSNYVKKSGTTGTIDLSQASFIPPVQTSGRNRIINGGFDVWQRGTSFSSAGYSADRWAIVGASGQTVSVSQQTFTAGTAPVVGYEGTNFLRAAWSGTPSGTYWLTQRVEDVRTFANQTVTLSFWAKASSNTSLITPIIEQNFGSGGSSVVTTTGTAISLTTVWQRFSQTFNIPSISGKTIGGSSYLDVRPFAGSSSVNGINFDLWGVQVEAGNSPTPFEVKPYAQELRECQRYYFAMSKPPLRGTFNGANNWNRCSMSLPVPMRVAPTVSLSGTFDIYDGSQIGTVTAFTQQYTTTYSIELDGNTATGSFTAGRPCIFYNGTSTGVISSSAEL